MKSLYGKFKLIAVALCSMTILQSVNAIDLSTEAPLAIGSGSMLEIDANNIQRQISPLSVQVTKQSNGTIEGINFDEDADNNTNDSGIRRFQVPADPYGAVGPNHLVSVVNTSVQWHTKGGILENSQRLGANPGGSIVGSFFEPLMPINSLFDPKVIFDQHADRFLIVALELDDNGFNSLASKSRILLAVSDDGDPNGVWYYHSINSKIDISGDDYWADYPGFSVDDTAAVYITANLFTFGDDRNFGGVRLWIVDKGEGADGFYDNGIASVSVHELPEPQVESTNLQPAHVFGEGGIAAAGGTYLVMYSGISTDSHDNPDGTEYLRVIRVDDPLNIISGPTFTHKFVSVGNIDDTRAEMPNAPQFGTSVEIETNDRRALQAVWRNNSLWVTAQVLPASGVNAGQVTAHWWEVDTTNINVPVLAQQGNIGGEDIAPNTHTFFPSISVDNTGNMGVGFAASGSAIFPGAYFTGRLATDSAGAVRQTEVLAAGLDFYNRNLGGKNRWGDYSSVALDPSDGETFCAFNQYALSRGTILDFNFDSDGRWGTRWGCFSTSTLTLFGDFNVDGCVDRKDLLEILNVIRLNAGILVIFPDPLFDFDLNRNHFVDIGDARTLVTLFSNPRGTFCEPYP